MPQYIITLGSNTANRNEMVAAGIAWLRKEVEVISATQVYSSPDAYNTNRPPYANAIVIAISSIDPIGLDQKFKRFEAEMGRDRATTEVPLDIDVVLCDSEILRPRDYQAPYFIVGLPLLSPQ